MAIDLPLRTVLAFEAEMANPYCQNLSTLFAHCFGWIRAPLGESLARVPKITKMTGFEPPAFVLARLLDAESVETRIAVNHLAVVL